MFSTLNKYLPKIVRVICIVTLCSSFAKAQDIKFEHITLEDGLPQSTIKCLVADENDFLWAGTQQGVSCILGNRVIATYDNNSNKGFTTNNTRVLAIRNNVELWVGTINGLFLFDLVNLSFKEIELPKGKGAKSIRSICPDFQGYTLIGTEAGLIALDDTLGSELILPSPDSSIFKILEKIDTNHLAITTKNKLFAYNFSIENGKLIPTQKYAWEDTVRAITRNTDTLFIGLVNGRIKKNISHEIIKGQEWKEIIKLRSNGIKINSLLINNNKRELWVGTNVGLKIYNSSYSQIDSAHHQVCNPWSILDNDIQQLIVGANNQIIIGTYSGGISIYDPYKFNFQQIIKDTRVGDRTLCLGHNFIWSIYKDKKGIIWLGTKSEGLLKLDKDEYEIIEYFRSSVISSIYEDSKGILWIGTRNNGLFRSKNNSKRLFQQISFKTPQNIDVSTIIQGENNSIVVGTRSNGIYIIEPNIGYDIRKLSNSPDGKEIYCISHDKYTNDIWVGSYGKGIFKVEPKNGKIELKSTYEKLKESNVLCITPSERDSSILWIGTSRNGIFKQKKGGEVLGNIVDYGFAIYAILEDKQGYLWVSTNVGLVVFEPDSSNIFQWYSIEDGLQNIEFNAGACFYDRDNEEMYFGGINGFDFFSPEEILSQFQSEVKGIFIYDFNTRHETTFNLLKETKPRLLTDSHFPVTFKFAPINYFPNRPLNYFVEIIGADGQTVDTIESKSSEGIIHTSDLKNGEGKYTIKVFSEKARGVEREISRSQSPLSIEYDQTFMEMVRKHRWATIFLAIIIFLISSAINYLLRERKKKRIQKQENDFIAFSNSIHLKINEISRLEQSTNEIFKSALTHLENSLKVDKAVFYRIDFSNRNVYSIRRKNKPNDGEIIENDFCTLDEVSNNKFLKWILETQKGLTYFNSIAYDKKGEVLKFKMPDWIENVNQGFVQFIFPVIHRSPSVSGIQHRNNAPNEDLTLGFYHLIHKLSKNEKGKTFIDQYHIQYQLYVDNFAQPYYKVVLKEMLNEAYEAVINCSLNLEQKSSSDENESILFKEDIFLQRILNNLALTYKGIKYGTIGVKTLNSNSINFYEKSIFVKGTRNILPEEHNLIKINNKKIGIAAEVERDGQTYICNDVKNDPFYLEVFADAVSEIGLALKKRNETIGVLILTSIIPNYFNKIHKYIFEGLSPIITENYLNQKRYESLNLLLPPLDIFSAEREVFSPISKSLERYFNSSYIGIWQKNNTSSNQFRISKSITSPDLFRMYEEFELESFVIADDTTASENYINPELIYTDSYPGKKKQNASIVLFCKKNHFHSYIILKILVEKEFEYFINIFLKRQVPKTFLNQENASFLKQIGVKASLALQKRRLIEFQEKMYKSIFEETKDKALHAITRFAKEALRADLVALFPYQEGHPILIKDNYQAGEYYSKESKAEDEKADFANIVLEVSEPLWIIDEKKYFEYLYRINPSLKSSKPKKNTFWYKENIKSVAAIRLADNNTPLGVMIFNYRRPKMFTKEEQSSIMYFTNLAKAAILNLTEITLFRTKVNHLEKERQRLDKKQRDLEVILDEMTPRAGRESYHNIQLGLNHDTNIFLNSLEETINSITARKEKLNDSERKGIFKDAEILKSVIEKIRTLLDLFNFADSDYDFVNVREIIFEIKKYFRDKREFIDFTTKDVSPTLEDIKCVRTELVMVIFNLVKNAIDSIETAIDENKIKRGQIKFATREYNNQFEISIEDNGLGIGSDYKERIYDIRFSTKERGLGVGLYFIKNIVQKEFQGTIKLKSELGHYARFTIYIPKYINYQ